MNYRDYIVRDPNILDGVPVLKGTQIPLKVVVGHLALGDSVTNILKTYPALNEESIRAVIAFTAALAEVEMVLHPGLNLDPKDKIVGKLVNDETVAKVLESAAGARNVPLALADMYQRQGYLEAARKLYERILESDPSNTEASTKLEQLKNRHQPHN